MTDQPDGALPVQFADLEPFCERWALADYQSRDDQRRQSDIAELRTVHARLVARAPAAMAHLDARPLAALDERDRRLARLFLALPVTGMAVEVFGRTDIADTVGLEMRVTGEPVL